VQKADVVSWWKSHRKKVRSYVPATLEDVRTLIREFTKTIDEETGEDEPILLPLPEGLPHLLVGEEVRKIVSGDHRTTTDGTPYTFCLPMTTLRIFKARRRVHGHKHIVSLSESAKMISKWRMYLARAW
jgi:hypothetical protein